MSMKSGSSTETGMQLEDAKGQIDSILQHFDVLTSKFDTFMFRYIYVYLIGLLLGELLIVPAVASQSLTDIGFLVLTVSALPMIVIVLLLWLFNAWRLSTPKTLRGLLEQKRIYLSNGNINIPYYHFLENYYRVLSSPKRYLLSVFPMIALSCLSVYLIVQTVFSVHLNILVTLLFLLGCLLSLLTYLGALYCTGIAIWVIHVSGRYVRTLVQTFELRIQPVHTDKSGGLKMLGDFCFGLASPLLIGFGLSTGYIFIYFMSGGNGWSKDIPDPIFIVIYRVLYAGLPLIMLLLYIFPAIVLTFILPLWTIHTKMVSEREAKEEAYNTNIEILREEMLLSLNNDDIQKAKILQEKISILETLHASYPTWPFSLRLQIFSTLLGTSGSLLIGMVTAAIPVILSSILHSP